MNRQTPCDITAVNLPRRQSQVAVYTAQGKSEKEMGHLMDCSVANIRKIKRVLMDKVHAKNSRDFITRAFLSGHLRFLTLIAAVLISSGSLTSADQTAFLRIARCRNNQSQRAQRNNNQANNWEIA
jgi:DNA-binding CsgD family transcriptional regulator